MSGTSGGASCGGTRSSTPREATGFCCWGSEHRRWGRIWPPTASRASPRWITPSPEFGSCGARRKTGSAARARATRGDLEPEIARRADAADAVRGGLPRDGRDTHDVRGRSLRLCAGQGHAGHHVPAGRRGRGGGGGGSARKRKNTKTKKHTKTNKTRGCLSRGAHVARVVAARFGRAGRTCA